MPATKREPRIIASEIIRKVALEKHSLDGVLPAILDSHCRDNALIHELAAGSLRWWWRLSIQADQLLNKPLKAKDDDLYCLLIVGLYQIQFTRIPDYASVSQTVNAAKLIGKGWGGKLLNALLRRFIKEQHDLARDNLNDAVYRYSHPGWIIDQLASDWPEDWRAILAANNKPGGVLTVRVNTQKISVEQLYAGLQREQIECNKTVDSPDGIVIADKAKIWQTRFWQEGLLTVQDESAQLAAHMTRLKPAMRVLDACAAPGGKTCHLLERQPGIALLALEKDADRIEKLRENLARHDLECDMAVADATALSSWWNGQKFDLILIDAPCSGSGVIHKHPDIKHLRRAGDIDKNVQTQRNLLGTLWSTIKTGGQLLYCTCSVFRQENDQQAQWFLSKHTNASEIALDGRFGRKMPHGRQRLPSEYSSDGFFYVGFRKTKA